MNLRPADAADAGPMARVHALAFEVPWSAEDITDLLASPGVFALAVHAPAIAGFILARAIAGEAEVLTVAVDPARRREGLARALLQAAVATAQAAGAQAMFLEVAADNAAAIALYEGAGFAPAGRRRAYYARAAGPAMDALVLRKALPAG